MVKARTLILKGLLEVLVLDALYREPRHGYGLIKDLEDAVGALPGKNQIYPLLTRLETEGLIASREELGDGGRPRQVFTLTHRGEKRLTEYKALPPLFRDRLLGLWAHGQVAPARLGLAAPPPLEDVQGPPGGPPSAAAPPAPAPPGTPAPSDAWVQRALDALPRGSRVACPHAAVELQREPATGTWRIHAIRADVGTHPGSEACALCFVIQAAVRLLMQPA